MSSNNSSETEIRMVCPHCKISFKKQMDVQNIDGLYTTLINKHPNGENCPPFLAFIDSAGKHRGSQKIDNIEHGFTINEQIVQNARNRINELKDAIRFYHLKIPREKGRGFEQKISNVTDRVLMGSRAYTILMESLTATQVENMFGMITMEKRKNFDGGLLVYGKYNGLIYTLFWKDQKSLQNQSIVEIQANANLTVEKLLDIYDLMDLFL
ncbi:MAG: hypothetical protein ACFFBP_00495 [Promethearchaeota archaeon]